MTLTLENKVLKLILILLKNVSFKFALLGIIWFISLPQLPSLVMLLVTPSSFKTLYCQSLQNIAKLFSKKAFTWCVLFYHFPSQGCTYYWLSKISRTISIWCGSQLARKSIRIAFSKLSQDEDVHSVWCGAHELGNYIKLFQCSFLWQLTGYKVLTFLLTSSHS